jgi:hypothetical protein
MPDVQEVFRMATQKVRPDPGALERQNRSQKRHVARQKATGFVVVGALVIGGAVFGIITLRDGSNEVGRPTATPTAQPAGQPSPPFTERFDSPLHGLSIGYPSGWRTRAATEPWGHDEVAFGAPDVDVIFHPTLQDDLYFAVVSEPLDGKPGSGVHAYRQPFDLLPSVGICNRAVGSGGGSGRLDGNPAWFQGCGTPFGSDSVVTVATATRGYIIYLHVGDGRLPQATIDELSKDVNGDWFEAALETVDLRPEDALDALNPSESP